MGTIATRKAREIFANAENMVAVELICAKRGLEKLFANLKPGGRHSPTRPSSRTSPPPCAS